MLRITLIGNLGAEPEVRYSQKGQPVATVSVAVNQVRSGPNGERQESTEWFRVRAMGRLVEFAKRLSKGTRVLVVGRLDVGHYQSRDGGQRTSLDIWADDIVALSPPHDPDNRSAPVAGATNPSASAPATSTSRSSAAPGSRPAGPSEAPLADEADDLPW